MILISAVPINGRIRLIYSSRFIIKLHSPSVAVLALHLHLPLEEEVVDLDVGHALPVAILAGIHVSRFSAVALALFAHHFVCDPHLDVLPVVQVLERTDDLLSDILGLLRHASPADNRGVRSDRAIDVGLAILVIHCPLFCIRKDVISSRQALELRFDRKGENYLDRIASFVGMHLFRFYEIGLANLRIRSVSRHAEHLV